LGDRNRKWIATGSQRLLCLVCAIRLLVEVLLVLNSVRMVRELARAGSTVEHLDLRVTGGVRNELVRAAELAAAEPALEASRDA
jgi:hypothetical protein